MTTTEADSPHQRFFAQTNEGDPRQVYAFDTRCVDPTVFFLARGGATEDVRRATRAGVFACPVPDCPCPTFKMVRSGSRRDHFVHEFDPGRDHLEVSPVFYVSRLLAESILRAGFDVLLGATLAANVVADVLIADEHGALVAVFATSARTSERTIRAQAQAARRVGASSRWVFCIPGPLSRVEDVERKECSWLVARQNRGIWVNPIERLVLTQFTGPDRRSFPPIVTPIDEWDMAELGVGNLSPVADPATLPSPASVWTARGPNHEPGLPTAEALERALAALSRCGFTGILLLTDQPELVAQLAEVLAPHVTVERVEPEEIIKATLPGRLVLLFGRADFVEHASVRVPDYADDQAIAYRMLRPPTSTDAVIAIAEGLAE